MPDSDAKVLTTAVSTGCGKWRTFHGSMKCALATRYPATRVPPSGPCRSDRVTELTIAKVALTRPDVTGYFVGL